MQRILDVASSEPVRVRLYGLYLAVVAALAAFGVYDFTEKQNLAAVAIGGALFGVGESVRAVVWPDAHVQPTPSPVAVKAAQPAPAPRRSTRKGA